MSIQSPNSYYAPNVGVGYENVEIPHVDTRAPTVYDYKYPLGKRWIDQEGQASYELCSVSSVLGEMQANWIKSGSNAAINTITCDTGSVTPYNGVISCNGIQQCLTNGLGNTLQVGFSEYPQFYTITTTHLLNSSVSTAAATAGQVTLVAGTATVNTTNITSASLVFLTVAALGTVSTPQAVCVSAITAGTSFVITSASNTDTSVVNWFFIN